MRGIRRWLATATCLVVCVSAYAQAPVGKPSAMSQSSPVADVGLPGGHVVGATKASIGKTFPAIESSPIADLPGGHAIGGSKAPVAGVTILETAADPPIPMPPVEKAPEPRTTEPKPVTSVIADAKAPLLPGGTPVVDPNNYTSDCCGPIGAHGPIGQEVYMRFGKNFPQGEGRLVFNLEEGWSGQIGLRSLFFDPTGSAAWVVDTHAIYMYNGGVPKDIHTFRHEPVTVRSLHRTAVGLGLGRDWFLAQPGFILDTWDTNFRIGIDGGGRYGSGHVDFDTPFEPGGYRRNQDVFGQTFAGLQGTAELPIGGWTFLFGARGEWDFTWSNFLEKDSTFHQFTVFLMFGVRY